MSINKFVAPGFLLSIDLLLVSFVNWIYWLLISKLTTATEVGQATSVYSFAVLTSAIALLGLEYSLVKKSIIRKNSNTWNNYYSGIINYCGFNPSFTLFSW